MGEVRGDEGVEEEEGAGIKVGGNSDFLASVYW